jgi:hypothetical protein
LDAILSWNGGDPNSEDEVTYHIYFGAAPNPPYVESVGPYPSGQVDITWHPDFLLSNTRYYWKIVAEDKSGATSSGPIWTFVTINETMPVTFLQISQPSHGQWITNSTNISFKIVNSENLNHTYFRIWHNGSWHPSPGTGFGLDNNFSIFSHNFTIGDYLWSDEGLYIIEYYSDTIYGTMENIHVENLYVDISPPSSYVLPLTCYAFSNNITIVAGGEDACGIAYFSLYYQYSWDNSTWSNWRLYGNNTLPQWNFSMPEGVGYYRFATIAVDHLGHMEELPDIPDAACRYFMPDLNSDGQVNVLDIIKIISHWEENPEGNVHALDLNGDGIINVKDIILILHNWTG